MCVDLFTWNRLVLSLSDSVRPSLCRQDPGTWSEASYELAHHLYTFSDHLIKFSSTAIPYGNPKHWSGLFGPRVAPLWIIPRCETPWSLASYDIPSESLHPDLHLPLLPLNARAHLHWASANTKPQSQPHRQCTAAHSRTLPSRQYATTVPVLALWFSGEAYYYASYVSIQLDNPNDNRNQRQHQRHLPFLLLPLTALPLRFGLTLATPPLHHPHLHPSILPLLYIPHQHP